MPISPEGRAAVGVCILVVGFIVMMASAIPLRASLTSEDAKIAEEFFQYGFAGGVVGLCVAAIGLTVALDGANRMSARTQRTRIFDSAQ